MNEVWEKAARFEHRFWLQILGDHSRFIHESLAPIELENIEIALEFIQIFDTLLGKVNSEDIFTIDFCGRRCGELKTFL
ncbi:DUF2935 domain-containing protein [Peribacillus simplex]|uniref:DUF2935 domain-containing protein n=1 Tax=Peribacillus simplex TaxID=1478 RepID=UPI0011A49B94|nr:DUF2935 domain-containing protein [Peribacillus simplex]